MPQPLTYPGVYIEEVPSGVRTISGVATSIGLFIGWAARGPTDKATRIFSFSDYERTYGGLDLDSPLSYAVKQFFENGGSDAYVIRIVRVAAQGITTELAASADATKDGTKFTATSPGDWANDYAVRIIHRADGDVETKKRFKLEVKLGDADSDPVIESFENLSIDPADPSFVEAAVNNRSRVIRVDADAAAPTDGTVKLGTGTTGANGRVLVPNDAEFEGLVTALFDETGIAANLDMFNLVCVPGETNAATIKTLQTKCAAQRAFLIVDAPANTDANTMAGAVVDYVGPEASYSALYFPWVNAPDPLQRGAIRAYPPSGYVAGVMARTDSQRGSLESARRHVCRDQWRGRICRAAERCAERHAQCERRQLPAHDARARKHRLGRAHARWRRRTRLGVEIHTSPAHGALSRRVAVSRYAVGCVRAE